MKSDIPAELQELTGRAAEWRFVSLLMSRPGSGWIEEVKTVCPEISNDALLQAAHLALSGDANEENFLELFGPGGRISPREVAYIGFEDPGQVLSDLMNFYQSFHYTPLAEDSEDHIAVQTGFMGFLSLKEAYACVTDQKEAAEVTHRAISLFEEKHLCRLIRGMAAKLIDTDPAYLQLTFQYMLQCVKHIDIATAPDSPEYSESFGCPSNMSED